MSSNPSRDPSFYAYDLKDSQTKEALKEYHDVLITALDHFWKLWSEDYLQSLAQRQQNVFNKSLGSASSPAVGDIVLVRTEDRPRAFWPLAIITRLNTSTDGSIRSVQLRTAKNTSIDRSIKHLIPLELHVSDEAMATPPAKPTPARIQPPRQVKRAASR
ncbi:hypothetical protein GCK32_005727 [Trichostrongylus colubriformis]|uniref:DUF5641 domain-containing protein n=1 Tax=Trichostrongylus colubriformis TaxID=6319 RepID=A0AAN8IYC8_TRICO